MATALARAFDGELTGIRVKEGDRQQHRLEKMADLQRDHTSVLGLEFVPHLLDTIERAVKRGTGELEGVDYETITYEGYMEPLP
mgnify:CR=1 FL=1